MKKTMLVLGFVACTLFSNATISRSGTAVILSHTADYIRWRCDRSIKNCFTADYNAVNHTWNITIYGSVIPASSEPVEDSMGIWSAAL